MNQPAASGGSRAVQGCLVAAVALFAFLLVAIVFLAYQRFREETAEPVVPPPTVSIQQELENYSVA